MQPKLFKKKLFLNLAFETLVHANGIYDIRHSYNNFIEITILEYLIELLFQYKNIIKKKKQWLPTIFLIFFKLILFGRGKLFVYLNCKAQ